MFNDYLVLPYMHLLLIYETYFEIIDFNLDDDDLTWQARERTEMETEMGKAKVKMAKRLRVNLTSRGATATATATASSQSTYSIVDVCSNIDKTNVVVSHQVGVFDFLSLDINDIIFFC